MKVFRSAIIKATICWRSYHVVNKTKSFQLIFPFGLFKIESIHSAALPDWMRQLKTVSGIGIHRPLDDYWHCRWQLLFLWNLKGHSVEKRDVPLSNNWNTDKFTTKKSYLRKKTKNQHHKIHKLDLYIKQIFDPKQLAQQWKPPFFESILLSIFLLSLAQPWISPFHYTPLDIYLHPLLFIGLP